MISDKQKTAMKIVDELVRIFGVDRWFTQSELPGITAQTMHALVTKGYLEYNGHRVEQDLTNAMYYRRIKELET